MASFSCRCCNASYASKYTLNRHMKDHHKLDKYVCDLCSKSYKRKYDLKKHKSKKHKISNDATSNMPLVSESLSKCEICNKVFAERQNLIQHLKSHSPNNKFTCDLCDKSYSRRNGLLRYARTHTG
ncbi:unnamed protein product [Larinioides sclopetarius]|uniref:C2H2-type domain-containing protein n=1 Tax=Larinioides sclopetarius TaxID=280406 RepID=A0AAV2BM76_9ARAC